VIRFFSTNLIKVKEPGLPVMFSFGELGSHNGGARTKILEAFLGDHDENYGQDLGHNL
jgi:hypothetical protein